jgi:hypothetical protein
VAITCPRCHAQYDVALFQFGNTMVCECGHVVDVQVPIEQRLRAAKPKAPDPAEDLRLRADAITTMILYGDEPSIDIQIAIEALRDWVREVMPDREVLFEQVYVARWRRLVEQGWGHE